MNKRVASCFHCPTELYDEIKTISHQEMISVSTFCRQAVKMLVEDYKSNAPVITNDGGNPQKGGESLSSGTN